jgi:hypothetical protein
MLNRDVNAHGFSIPQHISVRLFARRRLDKGDQENTRLVLALSLSSIVTVVAIRSTSGPFNAWTQNLALKVVGVRVASSKPQDFRQPQVFQLDLRDARLLLSGELQNKSKALGGKCSKVKGSALETGGGRPYLRSVWIIWRLKKSF